MLRRSVVLGLAGGLVACASPDPQILSLRATTLPSDWTWMETAPLAEPFTVEISFLLRDSFPTDTRGQPKDWPKQPLALPNFDRHERLGATSWEVEGHVSELASYYKAARAQMARYHASDETLYWLRLGIGGGRSGTTIRFAWWDQLSEMERFVRWIEEARDGETFDDLDQGWRVQAARRGAELFFLDTNWEENEELGKVKAPVATCVEAAKTTWARANSIVDELSRSVGINPWR